MYNVFILLAISLAAGQGQFLQEVDAGRLGLLPDLQVMVQSGGILARKDPLKIYRPFIVLFVSTMRIMQIGIAARLFYDAIMRDE